MTDTPIPAHWSADALSGIAAHTDARLPVFTAADVVPILPDHDFWDMWQIAYADGHTAFWVGEAGGSSSRRRACPIPRCATTRRASA